jgi:alpha-tubulin suppressor-like RCC1 family protein
MPSQPAAILGKAQARPVEIALSMFDVCGRRADDTVACWQSDRLTTPMNALVEERPSQLDAGRAHTCATLRSGRVACWGQNGDGPLGDGTRKLRDEAVLVVGLEDAVEVAAGRHHTCARRRGGQVACWGAGKGGELGQSRGRSTRPIDVPGVDDAIALETSVRAHQTCIIRESGTVSCWGLWGVPGIEVDTRRLGRGVIDLPSLPDDAPHSLAVNPYQVCARTQAGKVFCWERADVFARRGDVYAPPIEAFDGKPVDRIAAGFLRIYAQRDRTVIVRDRALGKIGSDRTFSLDP